MAESRKTTGNQAQAIIDNSKQTPPDQAIAGSQCDCPEMQKIKQQYLGIARSGRENGAHVAADLLEHWMSKSGKDVAVNVDWLRSFSEITQAEKVNQSMFVSDSVMTDLLPQLSRQKTNASYQDYWDRILEAPMWKELFYASGDSTITSRGLFNARNINGNITVTGMVEHHWWDPYDWHKGLTAWIPGHGIVKDDDAKKYEDNGCAKEFKMFAFWHQSFAMTYGYVQWGGIKKGRAPGNSAGTWSYLHDAMTDANGIPLPGLISPKNHPAIGDKVGDNKREGYNDSQRDRQSNREQTRRDERRDRR